MTCKRVIPTVLMRNPLVVVPLRFPMDPSRITAQSVEKSAVLPWHGFPTRVSAFRSKQCMGYKPMPRTAPTPSRGDRNVHTNRRSAFTLIEILMVVVILGMASAIVIPQINSRNDLKSASAARLVMADIMYAQNQAIVTQTRQYIKFDTAGKQYKLCSGFSPEVVITNPVTQGSYVQKFGSASTTYTKEMNLVSANFDGNAALAFDALGAPLAVASDGTAAALVSGSVVVGAGQNSMTITVAPYTGELTAQ